LGESFKDLTVWHRAVELSVAVYALTENFPRKELFGLSNQLRRAAVSVPSNIAEGFGRGSRRDYVYFLTIARGSVCEVETQLIIARKLGFGIPRELTLAESLTSETGKMLNALIRSLRQTK